MRETLRSADIDESDLNETTQILYPAKDLFSGHGIKLVELDEQLLEIVNKGDR